MEYHRDSVGTTLDPFLLTPRKQKPKETENQNWSLVFFPKDKGSGISFLSTLPPAAALEQRAPGHTEDNVFRQSSLL